MALPAEPYYYQAFRTWDLILDKAIGSTAVEWYAEGDSSFSTPLEVWDEAGTSLGTSVTSTAAGDVASYVLAVSRAVAKAGDWTSPVASYSGIEAAVLAARDAAVAAQAAAEANGNPLPAGGTTGQALVKNSGADYDVEWATVSGGGTGGHVIVDEATPLAARTNLAFVGSAVAVTDSSGTDTTTVTISAAAATHQHAASDITSGTLAVARIPTGTTGSTVALGNHVHTSVDDLPDAAVLSVRKSGTWPARPTADPDTVVIWIGADPAPSIVTSGTGGMYAGDVHVVTA